jgi:hypothetical protein
MSFSLGLHEVIVTTLTLEVNLPPGPQVLHDTPIRWAGRLLLTIYRRWAIFL